MPLYIQRHAIHVVGLAIHFACVCYSQRQHASDGSSETIVQFPPKSYMLQLASGNTDAPMQRTNLAGRPTTL